MNSKGLFKKLSKQFSRLNKEHKLSILYVVVIFVFILFFPIIKLTIIGTEETTTNLLFLRNNGSLFKSFIVVVIALFVLIGRNISIKIKDIITVVFGFKENPFLLNFGLLRIILTTYIGIGEGVSVSNNITTSIKLTTFYYVVLFLLLFGLLLTLYLTLQQSKKFKKNSNIYNKSEGLSNIKQENKDSSLQSLFKDKD